MRPAVNVVGGSLAALASVERLAHHGVPVRWCRPRRGVGGGFVPLVVDGHVLDVGARLFELVDGPRVQAPVPTPYRPGPTGFVPWWPAVTTYLVDLLGEEPLRIATAEQYAFGGWCDDAYVRVRLDGLRPRLPDELRRRIVAEASAIAASATHPSGVLALDDATLATMTMTEASIAQHGRAFHDALVAPLAAKLYANGTDGISARLRRRGWLPLFWPRTLAAELGDDADRTGERYLPVRDFHVDRRGGAGALVAALLDRIAASPEVETVPYDRVATVGARVELVCDGTPFELDGPCVLGTGAEETFAAAGVVYQPERTKVGLWWLAVAEHDLLRPVPSMGFVTDADVLPYRVGATLGTRDDQGRVVVTVEAGARCTPADVLDADGGVLARLGLVRAGAPVEQVHSLRAEAYVAPSPTEQHRFDDAMAQLRERGVAHRLVGGAAGLAADSINEQLCQALLVAEEPLALTA